MPQKMLTPRFVQYSSSPDAAQTDYFDLGCAGLSIRVGSSLGGKTPRRTWCLTYTDPQTAKRARLKLGTFPEVTLAKARELAIRQRAAVDGGANPQTVEDNVETLSDLIVIYQKKKLTKLRSADDILRRLNKNVVPFIGKAKLKKLHRLEISQVIERVEARGSNVEAARVFQDLQGMFRWALKRGNIEANPMENMGKPEAPSDPQEGRALLSAEIPKLWANLSNAKMDTRTVIVLKLALVTGQRIGEISGIAKTEIDREAAVWTIPGDRTKNKFKHAVPLSPIALDLIDQALAINERTNRKTDFVFPRGNLDFDGPLPSHSVSTAVRRSQEAVGLGAWKAHDLRRTTITGMLELDVDLLTVGHVVNHRTITRSIVTTKRYDKKDYLTAKRAALGLWGDHVSVLVGHETRRKSAPDLERNDA